MVSEHTHKIKHKCKNICIGSSDVGACQLLQLFENYFKHSSNLLHTGRNLFWQVSESVQVLYLSHFLI